MKTRLASSALCLAVAVGSVGVSVKGAFADLASESTNPVSNLMQFQLQYQNQSGFRGPASGSSNAYIVQPVIPIPLPFAKVPLVITRTTLPYVRTQNLPGIGRGHGFGDLSLLGLFTPDFGLKGQTIGLGPTISLPTAGDNGLTGSGKYEGAYPMIPPDTRSRRRYASRPLVGDPLGA